MADSQIWSRRINNGPGKPPSLSTSGSGMNGNLSSATQPDSAKTPLYNRRNGGESSASLGRPTVTTPGANLRSPSSAFSIGSGAFGFGSSKTPKTPSSSQLENTLVGAAASAKAYAADKLGGKTAPAPIVSTDRKPSTSFSQPNASSSSSQLSGHILSDKWVFWFRPPIPKNSGYVDYEKTLHPIACVGSVEEFFIVHRYLALPSTLPAVSDYHLFKEGIRPIWEDDINKEGGKWVVRVKKGVADRYWEELMIAMIGGHFECADTSDICGIVLSVRNGEDILSIWCKESGNRVLKVREILKRALNLPSNTIIDWKSHNDSLKQRGIGQQQQHSEKRAPGVGGSSSSALGGLGGAFGLKPSDQQRSQQSSHHSAA